MRHSLNASPFLPSLKILIYISTLKEIEMSRTGTDAQRSVDVQETTDVEGKQKESDQQGDKGVEDNHGDMEERNSGELATGYKGVQWDRKNNRWRARLHTDRTRHVGYFPVEEEAARAWDQALLRYSYGEDTIKKLNFPEESFAKFKEFLDHQGNFQGFDLRGVVQADAHPGKFSAYISVNRQQINVGTFDTAREAAVAYDWKSIQYFGWGSLTNFPMTNYEVVYFQNGGVCPLDNSILPIFPSHKIVPGYNSSQQTMGSKRGRRDKSHLVPGIFPGTAAQMPALDPKLAQMLHQSGINFTFPTLLQYPGMPTSPLVQGGSNTVVAGQQPNSNAMPETVVETSEKQWKASIYEHLGVYESHEVAKNVVERAKISVNGYTSVTPGELIKHLNNIEQTRDQLEHKIKEKGGHFYITLHIHSRGFELGPYKTLEHARMAHDKYALLIEGGKAKTFNSLIDILLESDEAKNLLSALGADSKSAPPVIHANAPIPQSSILANAYTTTLRKVASQASLHEEGEEFNKQLEKIESSIEGIQAVSKQQKVVTDVPGVQQQVAPVPPTSCPLPPFPQKSPTNMESNTTLN